MAAGANRDKIVASAQKYIQRGQLDKAIKEFQRILEEEPKDVRTLLKIGDLYSKKGERDKATETYLKVADFYSDQGFFLKAVAVYKQILKVEPSLVAVQHKLADLYGQLGLTSDALQQYHGVAQHFEKAGELTRTVQVLKRMTELEPTNFGSHIKLGEIYAKQNHLAEAIMELATAAGHLKQANRLDDYARVTERVLQLQPENAALTLELAEHYLARNDVKRALAKLQLAFKNNPRDIPTLEMLARAFHALEQPHKTASIYKELAKIHGEQGDADRKRQFLRKVLEVSPDDHEVRDELEFKVPSKAPAAPVVPATPTAPAAQAKPPLPQVPAGQATPPRQPATPPPPPKVVGTSQPAAPLKLSAPPAAPRGESLSKLLTETDVYLKYGLRDKALDHLKTIFSIDPDNLEAHGKVHEVYMQSGDTDGAKETLLTMAKISEKRGDHAGAVDRVQDILRLDPAHVEAQNLLRAWGDAEPELLADDDGLDLVVDDSLSAPTQPAMAKPVPAVTKPPPVVAKAPPPPPVIEHADEQDLDVDDSLFADPGEGDELNLSDEGGIDVELEVSQSGRHTLEASAADDDDGLDIDLGPPPTDELTIEPPTPTPSVQARAPAAAPVRPSTPVVAPEPRAAPQKPAVKAPETMAHEDAASEDDLLIGGDTPFGDTPVGDTQFDDAADDGLELDLDQDRQPIGAVSSDLSGSDDLALDDDLSIDDDDGAGAGVGSDLDSDAGGDELNLDAESGDDDAGVEDELGEAEFLDQQELNDEAIEAYRAVLAKAPNHKKAKRRLAELLGGEESTASTAAAPTADADELDLSSDSPSTDEHSAIARKDDPDDLFLDDPPPAPAKPAAVKPVATPVAKPVAPLAAKVVAPIAPLATAATKPTTAKPEGKTVRGGGETRQLVSEEALQAGGEFDLMSELADDFADAASTAPSDDDDLQFSADEVLAEFKKGVAKTVSDKDYATHYDLGIAYKEMGLIDDAIGEFEVSAKAPEKEIEAYTMMGLCKNENGDPDGAIAAYKRAAGSDRCSPKQLTAIEYEIALVLEGKGDHAGALKLFAKVAKADPNFRDAKDKAAGIKAPAPAPEDDLDLDDNGPQMPPPPATPPGPRKGKISYL